MLKENNKYRNIQIFKTIFLRRIFKKINVYYISSSFFVTLFYVNELFYEIKYTNCFILYKIINNLFFIQLLTFIRLNKMAIVS